jgi:NAD(P)-dependent dehydrogenase (short-subunit alcohol dehydrogenase family)
MAELTDKIAVVTGGGSGIGRATALLFAARGAHTVILDIDPDTAAETLELMGQGQHGTRYVLDLTDAARVEAVMRAIIDDYGRIDILVNVAGGSGRKWGDGPAHLCSQVGWSNTLALNLNSVFYCCKYALSVMLPASSGAIVNISSILGMVGGDEDFATHAYAASKGAVISLTRAIASYYAPHGICANVICPGLIATPMSTRAQKSEPIRARLPALQPLSGDFGSPQDVARAALYLASDDASFVTGAVLAVDGGWTVR